jgi:hypothetical protein
VVRSRKAGGGSRPTYPMVRLEVVNLLAKDKHPEVLAEELDHVEGVVEARAVPREAARWEMSVRVPTFLADDFGKWDDVVVGGGGAAA